MAERELIADKTRVTYEGYFSTSDLFRYIKELCADRGYDYCELHHSNSVTKTGKHVEATLELGKYLSDYAKSRIYLRIQLENLKDVIIEKNNHKKRLQEGKAHFVINAFNETDYENRWENKPIFIFWKIVYDRYVLKPITGGYEKQIQEDVAYFKDNVKAFLNLNKEL